MFKFIKRFKSDNDGAVTVDWVVLTAAVVGLAAASVNTIRESSNSLTGETSDYLERQDVTSNTKIQDVY